MLEFNLQGELLGVLDANIAYEPLSGGDASAYGLSQQNNLQPELAFDPLNAQDPLSALANEAQNQSAAALNLPRTALWSQGTPIQNPTSQPAGFGTDPSQTDQGSYRQQDISDSAQIDPLTDGHLGGRDILSTQPTTSPDLLTLDQANPAEFNSAETQLDPLTGRRQGVGRGFVPRRFKPLAGDLASFMGERKEVSDLLAQDRFNRDHAPGTTDHFNFTIGTTFSANEASSHDITDSLSEAAYLGSVAYRYEQQVIGEIGSNHGPRSHLPNDIHDYFRFNAAKSGTFDLSLTGLSADVGLALFDSEGSLIKWSNNSGTQEENLSTYLEEGKYTSLIYNYKGSETSFNLNISRQADKLEKFTENLIIDESVENAALNSIVVDSKFDRNDIIGILKSAGDNDWFTGPVIPSGSVTSTELLDLRKFWNAFNNDMRSDLAVLSEKVLFHDDSNAWYTGYDSFKDGLGDLKAGTSEQNLNLLIGKHMLGTDRPMIHTGSYTKAEGSLFVNGVDAGDVDQGATGSCYLLAGLAGTANDKPEIIEDMFIDNGDGTYSVRFHTDGKVDYVTVDSMMATRANGTYLHANAGGDGGAQSIVSDENELWVALAEKAYAQLNESGRLNQQEATNRYGMAANEGISWGTLVDGIEHVTGLSASDHTALNTSGINGVSSAELQTLVNGDNVVTVAWGGHARSIVGYDAVSGEYDIRNPYDENHSSLTHADLINLNAFASWSDS